MSLTRSTPDYAAALRLAFGLIISLLLLIGCTRTGDLGRAHRLPALNDPKPDRKAVFGSAAFKIGDPLTDEEKQLRALADGIFAAGELIETRGRFGAGKKDRLPGIPPRLQREAYAAYIVRGPFRSVTARYARLVDDTRDDIIRLETFFPVARKVAELDGARARGLAHVRGLSEAELVAARRRIRENVLLMTEVHHTLAQRAAIYRFTLERLVIAAPSPMAVDAERIRGDLERRLAAIEVIGRSSTVLAGGQPHITK